MSFKSSKVLSEGRSKNAANIARPKPLKPFISVARPPTFILPDKAKGKAKDVTKPKPEIISLLEEEETSAKDVRSKDDLLWVERFEPQTEADLAVHKKKYESVRNWLQEAFDGGAVFAKIRKYRRILVLTGLAGTGKTSTIRVLSREMGFKIEEWRNAQDDAYMDEDYERETHTEKFDSFFKRVTKVQELRTSSTIDPSSSSSQVVNSFQLKRQVVLLEDLPNILHGPTQVAFHAALERFVAEAPEFPVIVIISEASTRGETRDEQLTQGGGGYRWSKDSVDIRSVIPPSLLNGPFVTQISFNPVAPTLMTRALQAMLTKYDRESGNPNAKRTSKEELELIVETSNGDIRSAIMALQFSYALDSSSKARPGKKKKPNGGSTRALMEVITRREQALALFHLIGKILYNKRKGDPLSSSASAKDKLRDEQLDRQLRNPPPLPVWLADHHRRTSKVDVDTLYADSPVDTGLFSLYIHQNYTQFCSELEECEGVCDWLSWIDASGGEQWYQTNPHQFHLLTLGTLHSLPSPVLRLGQKMYKPTFFDALKAQRVAEDAVGDVRRWLSEGDGEDALGTIRQCNFTRNEIVLEMGTALRALSRSAATKGYRNSTAGPSLSQSLPPPSTHLAFSSLSFSRSGGHGAARVLDDDHDEGGDNESQDEGPGVDSQSVSQGVGNKTLAEAKAETAIGSWLENDDIEDFS